MNDSTLLGVDSNNDGVRDDVERWINRKFPSDFNRRGLFKQVAMGIAIFLKPYEGLSDKELKQILKEVGRSSTCAAYIYFELMDSSNGMIEVKMVTKRLRNKILNTKKRSEHYSEFQSKFHMMHGYADTSRNPQMCNFKPRNVK